MDEFMKVNSNLPWPLFVSLSKYIDKATIHRAAPKLKDTNIVLRHDLAPFLVLERKQLVKEQETLKKSPYNYKARLRDSPFKVWLEILKPNEKEWKTWKGTKNL